MGEALGAPSYVGESVVPDSTTKAHTVLLLCLHRIAQARGPPGAADMRASNDLKVLDLVLMSGEASDSSDYKSYVVT